MFTDGEELEEAIRILCERGEIDTLLKEVSNNLKNNGNRIYMNLTEKSIQVIIFTLLYASRKFNVYSEYETTNGYIDIYVKKKGTKSVYDMMIELKYIKKSDYSEELLGEKLKEGIEQIEKYSLDERIEQNNLKKYVIVFVGSEYHLKEVE